MFSEKERVLQYHSDYIFSELVQRKGLYEAMVDHKGIHLIGQIRTYLGPIGRTT